MTVIGGLICSLAILLLLIAALGVLRLPDPLARQHAATKAATLAVTLFAMGAAVYVRELDWTWRIVLIIATLLITLPLASHALAHAGAMEADRRP